MAYRLSVCNVHSAEIPEYVIDDPRKRPLAEMAFAHPDEIDGASSNPESRGTVMLRGYAVDAETAPRKFWWGGGSRPLPDAMQSQGVMIVSDRFRALVEKFEPGIHQFIPVSIFTRKKGDAAATYYWFNLCNRVDTVDHDRTTYVRKPSYGGTYYWSDRTRVGTTFTRIENARIVFDDARIAGNHLWVEPEILSDMAAYHCSTAFGDAVKDADFSGIAVTPRSSLYICHGG